MDNLITALIKRGMNNSGWTEQVAQAYALGYICFFISDCAEAIPELNDKIQERLSFILNSTTK